MPLSEVIEKESLPMKYSQVLVLLVTLLLFSSCAKDEYTSVMDQGQDTLEETFGTSINLNQLANYANQDVPGYISRDNTINNYITDPIATLGRVLFYDKNLSSDNSVSCATCHKQSLSFGDNVVASRGVNGLTGRHSMRLINNRFSDERHFFWDERARTLEDLVTQPIRDPIEMGFSGQNGAPDFTDFLAKMEGIGYYETLFTFVYGDAAITETRIKSALGQFISSIQSFDSKFDEGRANTADESEPFANFTAQENRGKNLFLLRPEFDNQGARIAGGIGCAECHLAPDFSLVELVRNNGVTGVIGSNGTDLSNTKAPSLRGLFATNGTENGPFFHDGSAPSLRDVLAHYNRVPDNSQLDPRLRPDGNPQRLQLTDQEIDEVIAFLKTLSGSAITTDERWSDPF